MRLMQQLNQELGPLAVAMRTSTSEGDRNATPELHPEASRLPTRQKTVPEEVSKPQAAEKAAENADGKEWTAPSNAAVL